jgi:hypothetical protein
LDLTALDPDICPRHEEPFSFVLDAVHPQRKLTKNRAAIIRRYGPAMTVEKDASEVERDNTAAELDALWPELGALMRVRR